MCKKMLLCSVFMFIIMLTSNSSLAAKTEEFGNLTEVFKDTCIVKYGKAISILDAEASVTVSDSKKARVNGDKLEIIGTGKFNVTVEKNGQAKTVEFFAWNGFLKYGKFWTYTNADAYKKFDTVYSRTYFSLKETKNGSFKIKEHFCSTGKGSSIDEKYLTNYYNSITKKSTDIHWKYSFELGFPLDLPIEDPSPVIPDDPADDPTPVTPSDPVDDPTPTDPIVVPGPIDEPEPSDPAEPIVGDGLKVYFLPVGNADSIVIVNKGKVALIDGGGGKTDTDDSNAYKVVKKFLKNTLGVSKIDYLIGTHTHPDHVGIWYKLVKDFEITEVYVSQYAKYESKYNARIGKLFEKEKITELKAGDEIDIGDATLKVLAPWNGSNINSDILTGNGSLINLYSLVAKLTYGETSFMLTADSFEDSGSKYARTPDGKALSTWMRTTYKDEELAADVLKLPHHGLNNIPEKLLKKILPEVNKKQYVVVTCDANEARHLTQNKVINESRTWILTLLKKLRPDAKFVYPSLHSSYVLFESDGKKIKCTKK